MQPAASVDQAIGLNELIPFHHISEYIGFNDLRRFDWWCRNLHVSRHKLALAVLEVGGDPEAVRRHLNR
jgi:hypothetical protein